ncbi:MAG: single-stranded DNA-binding protein [Clostridiales bacterium]|nr:single-stranded DNA-binding protein [Clostridiales bacterium]
MNKVILIGRLTKDPEIRYSSAAEPLAIARYTVAVNRRFRREGEPDADFINCVSFGKSAEFMEKYFKKGMSIGVVGRLSVRTYDDANGVRKWITEVLVEDQEFTESRNAFESRSSGAPREYAQPQKPSTSHSSQSFEPEGFSSILDNVDEEDLPF